MPTPHPRPFHRDSLFGDGPRLPMCRERRAVWRARLVMFRRARKITPLFEDIGLAMLRRLGTDGRLDPSHATLADDVGCDPRSVRRALAAFRQCGLATWVQRLARAGWRAVQISSAYVLTIGDPPEIPVQRCGGQAVLPIVKQDTNPLQTASAAEMRTAQKALADRCKAVQAMLTHKRR